MLSFAGGCRKDSSTHGAQAGETGKPQAGLLLGGLFGGTELGSERGDVTMG